MCDDIDVLVLDRISFVVEVVSMVRAPEVDFWEDHDELRFAPFLKQLEIPDYLKSLVAHFFHMISQNSLEDPCVYSDAVNRLKRNARGGSFGAIKHS